MISDEGLDGERLGQARHALQQDVAAGQQAHQEPLHHGILPHDAARYFLQDPLNRQQLGGFGAQLGGAHFVLLDVGRGRLPDALSAGPVSVPSGVRCTAL